jgi:hypothetical protein
LCRACRLRRRERREQSAHRVERHPQHDLGRIDRVTGAHHLSAADMLILLDTDLVDAQIEGRDDARVGKIACCLRNARGGALELRFDAGGLAGHKQQPALDGLDGLALRERASQLLLRPKTYTVNADGLQRYR